MSTTSIPNQVRIFLGTHAGFHTTREIAEALGLETKVVSSAVSKLVKANRIVREDGKVADPTMAEQPEVAEEPTPAPEQEAAEEQAEEAEEDLIGDLGDEATEEQAEAVEEDEEAPAAGSREFDLESMKRKISALLAKAERTENEHERDAFNAKAESLMLRLGVHAAELEAAGEVKPEEIVEVKRDWKGNYSIVFVPFTSEVARGFGNLTVLQSTYSAMLRRTYIIGHKSDVEQFMTLLNSLELQVLSALHRWQRENRDARRGLTDMQKYIQHRSFIEGFGQTVASRLRAERKQEEAVASTGAALVLASKMDRITGWVDETYGELGKARGGMKYGSSVGYAAGSEAGKTANLGGTSVKGGAKGALQG